MSSTDSVQERTFSLLRNRIIDMELPPGTAMSAYELSERLAVSRTPVREALIRLSGESLVTILPQRMTLVSKIDFARVKQERFLREALELAAMPGFLRNLDGEMLKRMRANLRAQREAAQEGRSVEVLRLDDDFHRIVFEAAGQMLSWGVIERMGGHYRRVRLLMVEGGSQAEGVVDEHEALIEAFAARDRARATAMMERHLRNIILQETALREAYPDFFEPEA